MKLRSVVDATLLIQQYRRDDGSVAMKISSHDRFSRPRLDGTVETISVSTKVHCDP